jgi:Endonuclease-reverse transcriptase
MTTQWNIRKSNYFLQNEDINLLNVYIAPHAQVDSTELETIFKDKTKSIILGDFNAHNLIWGSRQNHRIFN